MNSLNAVGTCPKCGEVVVVELDYDSTTCPHCGKVSALYNILTEDEWIGYIVFLSTVDVDAFISIN